MRANNTDTEYYLYDREDRIGDYDQSGNLLISYTHGPATDEPVAMTVNGSTYFYIPDIQGSIRAIVDTSGNLMASYVYDVWGNLISHNGPLSEKNDYLYTGREYDWETGIYYYRYRYYNPEIGRFMQSSWEINEEMNMYVYVNNDPVKGMDPMGHPGGDGPPTLIGNVGDIGGHEFISSWTMQVRAFCAAQCACGPYNYCTSWERAHGRYSRSCYNNCIGEQIGYFITRIWCIGNCGGPGKGGGRGGVVWAQPMGSGSRGGIHANKAIVFQRAPISSISWPIRMRMSI